MKDNLAIVTKDLKKKYGEIIAVNNLSLNIKTGETYGLLGPNGAGKTTTVRVLNCIIKPTSGEGTVLGFDLATQSNEVKTNTGYLPESPALYDKLTAVEYLEFVGELYYLPKELIMSRSEDLLKLFQLYERKNDLIEEYSRGMKQRLCLCAAIFHDPEIIFLDEPTSNLDPVGSKMVKDLISLLSKKANKTIFICTHLLDVAEELCNRIGIIKEGVLKLEGTTQEIIALKDSNDLEEAYLKIFGSSKFKDLLFWRDNNIKK
ncbi:MAG: ATP-binding cassette domain-containing protein [Candidatus Lokiarchaeota archaeon]|nr:ATP-binding cassette domain-containing protein [Candidatus Lokiarchaeota archaeon]